MIELGKNVLLHCWGGSRFLCHFADLEVFFGDGVSALLIGVGRNFRGDKRDWRGLGELLIVFLRLVCASVAFQSLTFEEKRVLLRSGS